MTTEVDVNKRLSLGIGLLICTGALTGCGTAAPVGADRFGVADIPSAGFKLDAVKLLWQDNPAFRYQLKFFHAQGTPAVPHKATNERAAKYVEQLRGVFSEHAVPLLSQSLLDAGAKFGGQHTLVITPMTAYFDDAGWGNHIVVRATILSPEKKALWSTDIQSKSGLHWLGGVSAPAPDESFVRNFASALTNTMKKAGLL